MNQPRRWTFLLLLASLLCAGEIQNTLASERPPNVVLIFADDLGYGDVGCYGATKVKTPNIDRLAKEGRRFTDAHSASAVCTPSRFGLLTGEYPLRGNNGRGIWGPAPITSGLLINPEKRTIADVFKSSGYDTAVIGKWHLGFKTGKNNWQEPLRPGPQDLGFDYYFGMPVVNSAPPYVYVENDRVVGGDPNDPLVLLGRNAKGATPITPIPPEAANRSRNSFGGATEAHKLFNDYQVGTTFAKKSVEWIKARKDKPFFLYLATTNIHHPFTPAKRFQGTSQCGLYGDFIHELDWIVGEVLKTLEEQGLSDNTLVIFTSDNGGMFNYGGQAAFKAGHRQNGDLLGFKFGVWEGGHRVPFIAKWPGNIKAGTTSNQLISGVDIFATFAAITGQTVEKKQAIDSVNMLPSLVSDPEKPIRDHLVLAPNKGTHLSLRKGKWMYIPKQGSGGFGGRTPSSHTFAGPAAASFVGSVNSDIENGKIKKNAPPAQLYDLENDVNQTKNLYREHPDVVKELNTLLASYKGTTQKPGPKNGNANTGPRNSKQGKPAIKTAATPSKRSASFDFESGKLAPWKIVEGKFGHVIGSRDRFFHNKGEWNKQGKHYLTTLEWGADAPKGEDKQTGTIVSPLFIAKAGKMTFRVGGGGGKDTFVVLCQADGKELQKASGINSQTMQKASWDLTPYAGKKLYLKVVDQSTVGWGHITVDDFQFDAEVLDETPNLKGIDETKPSKAKETSSMPTDGSKQTRRPNFVIIFTDDQGYGDLSCFGGKHVSTPRIDKMAKEGAKLTSFYVAAPVCTPSRAALMTGSYPKRIDMATGSNFGVLLAGDRKGLNPNEITIAEVLKSAGYKTGMFGKWHLGDQPAFLPTKQGFDEFFGIPYSHDIHPHHPRQKHYRFPPLALLENDTVIEMDPSADFLTKRITERAVKFIEKNKDEPFFLYIPHPIPHRPLHVSPPFMQGVASDITGKLKNEGGSVDYKTRDKLFQQAIAEIDWSVGQILDTLKAQGIDENTLVIFTSDNGPAIGSAGPLKGRKGSTFEGGMRESTVIRWPGTLPAGKPNDEIMTTMDLLPTFAKLAGAKIPTDRVIDGKDIWPTLVGEAQTPHEAFFYHRGNQLQAVRSGKWKLHANNGKPTQLYDLTNDIGEKKNVIQSNPDVVQKLNGYLKAFTKDIADNNRPAAFVENPKPLSMKSTKASTPPTSTPLEAKTTRVVEEKPNFVIVFTDDQGYQDLGCYGSPDIKTPHIDKMAKEGMKFTSFYAQTVCGPSRAALMTGCYPMRTERHEQDDGRIPHPALSLNEITIPEILKPLGYQTAMIGKWDLAGRPTRGKGTFNVDLHPSNQGFDYSFWTMNSGNSPIREDANVSVQKPVRSTLTNLYTNKAIEFIETNNEKRFFVYLAHPMPHTKLAVSEKFKGKSKGGLYGDVIEELDHNVGRLLTRIKDLGLDENTYLIFMSDNGPWWREGEHAGHCEPLRSAKTSTYEGGLRVPFIIRAPGRVPAGRTSDLVCANIDLLPTIAKLAGAKLPDDRVTDGLDISDVFHGIRTELDRPFFYYQHQALRAVRQGNWKLHLPHTELDRTKEGNLWQTHVPPKDRGYIEEITLYNLTEDIGETKNVSKDHPDIVEKLLKQIELAKEDIGFHDTIGKNSRRNKYLCSLVTERERNRLPVAAMR